MLLAESDDAQTLSMLFVPFTFQLWQSPQLKWREADMECVCWWVRVGGRGGMRVGRGWGLVGWLGWEKGIRDGVRKYVRKIKGVFLWAGVHG